MRFEDRESSLFFPKAFGEHPAFAPSSLRPLRIITQRDDRIEQGARIFRRNQYAGVRLLQHPRHLAAGTYRCDDRAG